MGSQTGLGFTGGGAAPPGNLVPLPHSEPLHSTTARWNPTSADDIQLAYLV